MNMTLNQMATEVLQYCMDQPSQRETLFIRAGNGTGILQMACLWLAMLELQGKPLATPALEALRELKGSMP